MAPKRAHSPSGFLFTSTVDKCRTHRFKRGTYTQYSGPEADSTEDMGATAAQDPDTAPATTPANNLIYRIHYDRLPYNVSPGHAKVHEGPGAGYTNDPELAELAAMLARDIRLVGTRWKVFEVKFGARDVPTLMRMDSGSLELRNRNWVTFHGRS